MLNIHHRMLPNLLVIIILSIITLIGCAEKSKCYDCERVDHNGPYVEFRHKWVCNENDRKKYESPTYGYTCTEESKISKLGETITGPSGEMMNETIVVYKDTTECPCKDSENQ